MSENVQPTDAPKPKELNFMDQAEQWLESLPLEDSDKFIDGLGLESILVLFKYFPDNPLIKEILQEKI